MLAASDSTPYGARRLDTLHLALDVEALTADVRAAQVWAEVSVRIHEAGRRMNVNDLWIGSVAIANGLTLMKHTMGSISSQSWGYSG